MSKTYWVYILRCSDGSFYTGSTSDIEKRLSEHQNGLIKCYTRSRRPVKLVFSDYFERAYDAISAERQIKGWRRAKKKALIKGDFDLLVKLSNMKNAKKKEKENDL
ncbi:MAG: GIY-YIG nuclease family protein [Candidatus Cloacimonetes bacterium]|nr:GIY-YIG nuclease family protein [Candidatus Cloacimonadota bacterium]